MAATQYYTDGSPGFGTTSITINAQTYVVEECTINRPVIEAEDFNNLGEYNRKRVTQARPNGTFKLQADSSMTRPPMGFTFSYTVDANLGAETFVVKEVPFESSNDAGTLRKFTITVDAVKNSITVV